MKLGSGDGKTSPCTMTLHRSLFRRAGARGAAGGKASRGSLGGGAEGLVLNAPDATPFEISQNGLQHLVQLLKGYIFRE